MQKQMPGMVLINRILPGFENCCIALTIVTVPGWQRVI